MEDLVRHQPKIFEYISKTLETNRNLLRLKCERLVVIQKQAIQFISTVHECNRSHKDTPSHDESIVGKDRENAIQGKLEDEWLKTSQTEVRTLTEDGGIDYLEDKEVDISPNSAMSDISTSYHKRSDLDDESFYVYVFELWYALRPAHLRLHKLEMETLAHVEISNIPEFVSSEETPIISAEGSHVDCSTDAHHLNDAALCDNLEDTKASRSFSDDNTYDVIDDYNEAEVKSKYHNNSKKCLLELMTSKRWKKCFPSENPLFDFCSGPGGLLAIQSLTQFLNRFGDKASNIVVEFAIHRNKICSLPIVTLNVLQICLTVLKIVTPQIFIEVLQRNSLKSNSGDSTILVDDIMQVDIHTIARECTWKLLNDELCLEVLSLSACHRIVVMICLHIRNSFVLVC